MIGTRCDTCRSNAGGDRCAYWNNVSGNARAVSDVQRILTPMGAYTCPNKPNLSNVSRKSKFSSVDQAIYKLRSNGFFVTKTDNFIQITLKRNPGLKIWSAIDYLSSRGMIVSCKKQKEK